MSKAKDYEKSLAELTAIQEALENNEVSIDELSAKVRRAHELLAHCRRLLRNTQDDVDRIMEQEEG